MPRKLSLTVYSIIFVLCIPFLKASSDDIVLDFGQIDQNSILYPADFPLYQTNLTIGNLLLSSYQGVPLGSYLRIKENVDLFNLDTVTTNIDYIQGDYLYRDLIVGYHAPIYADDVISIVSQNRKFPGYYANLENNLQNHSLQYLNHTQNGHFGVGFLYHSAGYNLPLQSQSIYMKQEDFYSGISYRRSIGRFFVAMSYMDQYGEHYSDYDGNTDAGIRKYSISMGYGFGQAVNDIRPVNIFIHYLSSKMVGYMTDDLDKYQIGAQGNFKRLDYMFGLSKYNDRIYMEYAFAYDVSNKISLYVDRYLIYGHGEMQNKEINKFTFLIRKGQLELSLFPILVTETIAHIDLLAGMRLGYNSDAVKLNVLSYIYNSRSVALRYYNSVSFSFNPSIKGKRFKPFIDTICSWYSFNGEYDSANDYTGIYMQQLDSGLNISPLVSIGVETRQFRFSYNIKNTSQAEQLANFYPKNQIRYMKVEWLFKK